MAEEATETTDTAEPASETEALVNETPTEPVGDDAPKAAEPAPRQPTPDEIVAQAEERAFQRMASWQGRQNKELLDKIERRLQSLAPAKEKSEPKKYDDPDQWFEDKFNEKVATVTEREKAWQNEIVTEVGAIMDGDPLFSDKLLGTAVIAEIKDNFAIAKKTKDPALAAELLVNNAVRAVMRKQNAGKNKLSGNTPVNRGPGVMPAKETATAVKPVKISSYAREAAKKWGYKEDDLKKVFTDR